MSRTAGARLQYPILSFIKNHAMTQEIRENPGIAEYPPEPPFFLLIDAAMQPPQFPMVINRPIPKKRKPAMMRRLFILCPTSKMSHEGKWRGACVSRNRDIYRNWLQRFVRLSFHFIFRPSPSVVTVQISIISQTPSAAQVSNPIPTKSSITDAAETKSWIMPWVARPA